MKLLSRTTYILVTTVLVIFSLGGIVFYLILKQVMDREIREELNARMEIVVQELQQIDEGPLPVSIPGYLVIEAEGDGGKAQEGFRDSLLIDPLRQVYMEHLVLTRFVEGPEGRLQVQCFQSLHERYTLTERIILMVTIIVLVFFFVVYVLNRYIFQRTWSDFFQTIDLIRSYDVNSGEELNLGNSRISEFQELNAALSRLISKIRADYENIRQFTGNISHEIQTPLTVIRQKSETLLQSSMLDEQQMQLLQDLQQSVTRLARLNKTLVLLTRIESRQFKNRERIAVHTLIREQLEILSPLAEANGISISYEKTGDFYLDADRTLAEVLLVNLLKNAVNHNIPGGRITIRMDEKSLLIMNSAEGGALNPQEIFRRYHSGPGKEDSLGLGLAIVHKICELYSINLNYSYEEDLHCFELNSTDFLQN